MIRDFDLLSFLKFCLLIKYLKHRISESKQSIRLNNLSTCSFLGIPRPVPSLQNDIFNVADTCRPSNVSIIYLLLLNIKLRTVNVIK